MSLHHQKIILFGGSFNPPHAGHLYVAQQVQHYIQSPVVWLVAWQNRLKEVDQTMNFHERVRLCKQLVQNEFVISEDEYQVQPQNTWQMIKYYKQHLSLGQKLLWVMGSDSALSFSQWAHKEELAASMGWLVVNRGHGMHEVARESYLAQINTYQPNIQKIQDGEWHYLDVPHVDISSTEIRMNNNK